jgi:hypothetical protein
MLSCEIFTLTSDRCHAFIFELCVSADRARRQDEQDAASHGTDFVRWDKTIHRQFCRYLE